MAIDDEQTPLLADQLNDEATVHQSPSKDTDPNLVDFDPEHDPDNPLDFSRSYKWIVTALLALMAFNTTFTCVGVVPVADRIIRDLSSDHKPNKSASVLLVTIWELGEAAGPLLIGPLSELYGRRLIINVANTGFVAATILAALCQDPTLFIAARVLTGLAVASNVLNPAIVGDIFISEHRGSAMSLIMLAPMVGGAVGPAIAGGLAETLGWRAILWLSVILMSICCVSFILVFRETYKVVILRRRAAHLRLTTNNPNLHTPYDALRTSLGASILRPFTVFFSSPVLIAVSLYASTTFTVFYIMSTTLPNILTDVYHLTPAQTGSAFIVFSVGSTLGVILCNLTLDRIYIYLRDRGLPKPTTGDPPRVGKPEHRLRKFSSSFTFALQVQRKQYLDSTLQTTTVPRSSPLYIHTHPQPRTSPKHNY